MVHAAMILLRASGRFGPVSLPSPGPETDHRPRSGHQVWHQEEPDRSRDLTSGRGSSMGNQSIGIHANGIDTMPGAFDVIIWRGTAGRATRSLPIYPLPQDGDARHR